MSAINTKTKEYIQALLETEEMKTYKKAFEAYKQDTEAQQLLKDFQETQQTCAVFRQGGFDGLQEEEKKLEELNKKLSKNQIIQHLIQTQDTLKTFIGDLVGDINKGINFPFAQPRKSCCG